MATDWQRCQRLFRCLFSFLGVEVIAEILGAFLDILLGKVGIDFVHGGNIVPSADFCGNHLWDLKVVGKRGEAVAQAVETYLGQIIGLADLVDLFEGHFCAHGHDILFLFFYALKGFQKRRNDGNDSPGTVALVLFLIGYTIDTSDTGTVDVYDLLFYIHLIPFQSGHLRSAEAG